MSRPKLILKVQLIKKTEVEFTLLQMTDIYNGLKTSKFLFTNNQWTIYQAAFFLINKKNCICFPENALRQQVKLSFNNDDERYNFMKSMTYALAEWSKSHFFDYDNIARNRLNFHNSIWVIF